MHGASTSLTAISLIAVIAALTGLVMLRMKQPALVGFIITGVILGNTFLDSELSREGVSLLAELGVILLLYFLGMEMPLRTFRYTWHRSTLVVGGQIALGIAFMWPFYYWLDWPFAWMILGGFCLALSSTAVAMKIMEDQNALKSRSGRSAMGILIAQDLAVAPMLLIIASLAPRTGTDGESSAFTWVLTAGQLSIAVIALAGIIIYFSRREKVDLAWMRVAERRADILPLISLAFCFALATIGGLFGLSPAFGAFLAGLIVGNSNQREILHRSAEPVQAVLLMVFFLSVGLLLDLSYVVENWFVLLLLWLVVTVFKTVSNTFLARIMSLNWSDSLTTALLVGQMGEFSFVMVAAALSLGVISAEVQQLIVAVTVLSLATSPIYVQMVRRNRHRAMRHISNFHDLMRLLFFRERRLGRRVGNWVKGQNPDGDEQEEWEDVVQTAESVKEIFSDDNIAVTANDNEANNDSPKKGSKTKTS